MKKKCKYEQWTNAGYNFAANISMNFVRENLKPGYFYQLWFRVNNSG